MKSDYSLFFQSNFKRWLKQQNYLQAHDIPILKADSFGDVIFHALVAFFDAEDKMFNFLFPCADIDALPIDFNEVAKNE